MKFYIVIRDGVPLIDEPLATQNGAESFIRICRGIDRRKKQRAEYSWEIIEDKRL